VTGDGAFRLSGRIEEDHLARCRRRCSGAVHARVDLTETTLVDLAAVRFLAAHEGTA